MDQRHQLQCGGKQRIQNVNAKTAAWYQIAITPFPKGILLQEFIKENERHQGFDAVEDHDGAGVALAEDAQGTF